MRTLTIIVILIGSVFVHNSVVSANTNELYTLPEVVEYLQECDECFYKSYRFNLSNDLTVLVRFNERLISKQTLRKIQEVMNAYSDVCDEVTISIVHDRNRTIFIVQYKIFFKPDKNGWPTAIYEEFEIEVDGGIEGIMIYIAKAIKKFRFNHSD